MTRFPFFKRLPMADLLGGNSALRLFPHKSFLYCPILDEFYAQLPVPCRFQVKYLNHHNSIDKKVRLFLGLHGYGGLQLTDYYIGDPDNNGWSDHDYRLSQPKELEIVLPTNVREFNCHFGVMPLTSLPPLITKLSTSFLDSYLLEPHAKIMLTEDGDLLFANPYFIMLIYPSLWALRMLHYRRPVFKLKRFLIRHRSRIPIAVFYILNLLMQETYGSSFRLPAWEALMIGVK